MAEIVKQLFTQILLRNDTKQAWENADLVESPLVLGKGEIGVEIDTNQFKIGDGTTNWKNLPYFKGALDSAVTSLSNDFATEKGKIAKLEAELYGEGTDANSRLDQLAGKVNDLEVVGGQANVIEGVAIKTVADGSYTPLTITEKVAQLDLSGYAVKSEVANTLAGYYTSAQVDGLIADFVDTTELASELANYVLGTAFEAYKAEVAQTYATKTEVSQTYATKQQVTDVVNSLNDYVKADAYATDKQALEGQISAKVAQSDYNTAMEAVNKELDDNAKAIEDEVKARGEEITRVEGLITGVTNSLSNYETKADADIVRGRVKTIEDNYLSKTDAANTYETQANVKAVADRVTVVEEDINKAESGIKAQLASHTTQIAALQTAQAGGLVREIVTSLPNADEAAENTIYMMKRASGLDENDVYDEYIVITVGGKKQLELLGNTELNLDGYATETYADNAAQAAADTLYKETGDAKSGKVVSYINEQVTGVVNTFEPKISGLETKVDVEKVSTAIEDAVKVEKDRAELAEKGLGDRVKAIEDDYLKAADKTELSGKITDAVNAINTEKGRVDILVGSDTNKSVRDIVADAQYVKSVGDGFAVDSNGVLNFASGIFVLNGGSASSLK